MTGPAIVPATRAHLEAVGERPRAAGRALAAVLEGRCIGVCGYFHDRHRVVLYARVSPELRAWPKVILLGAKIALGQAARLHAPIVAYADPEILSSRRTLEYLGFVQVGDGDTYWRPAWPRQQ